MQTLKMFAGQYKTFQISVLAVEDSICGLYINVKIMSGVPTTSVELTQQYETESPDKVSHLQVSHKYLTTG